ncbi:MAG TPA: fatty acid desaturase [Tepidisphaeraceae bacterium]|jgi:stearoyl-CoA desaturase (delta-9 desaturase)
MDLWSTADRWAPSPDAPAEVHHAHEEPPPTLLAAIVMWVTALGPYVGIAALAYWTYTLPSGWLLLTVFALSYLAVGFGVTIGYHRLLAHKSFNTHPWVEAIFYILGCMAMQGPPIRWTATHRRHHQRSDQDGDPHSPHLAGNGVKGVILGLWHAHTGWLLTPDKERTDRSVKDLLRNPMIRFVDRNYWLWLALSVAVPFALGLIIGHTLTFGLICVFWAVIVRISLMHHATWSVNSICHFFGYQSFRSDDHSRNNPIVAIISLGEGWHNNHHAFPTSARHGMRWYEFDISWCVIRTLELLGLAWDVRRPSASAMTQKAAGPASAA